MSFVEGNSCVSEINMILNERSPRFLPTMPFDVIIFSSIRTVEVPGLLTTTADMQQVFSFQFSRVDKKKVLSIRGS